MGLSGVVFAIMSFPRFFVTQPARHGAANGDSWEAVHQSIACSLLAGSLAFWAIRGLPLVPSEFGMDGVNCGLPLRV